MTSLAIDDTPWILVADDEPAVRQFVERALNYAGYAVTCVEDGKEALDELKRKRYDLLLTDIVMPELDGIALAQQASQDYPEMRILMMTGYSNQVERAHNQDFLKHHVITKPFTLDEITQRVGVALRG